MGCVSFYEEDTGSIIQSEIYDVWDCLVKDVGTSSDYTDLFNNMNVFTRLTDGTKAYYENTSSSTVSISFSNFVYMNDCDTAIDFELVECNYCNIQVGRYLTGGSTQYEQAIITGTGQVHIELRSNGTYVYLDTTLIRSDTSETNMERCTLFFRALANTTMDFKYKNLKVYPI